MALCKSRVYQLGLEAHLVCRAGVEHDEQHTILNRFHINQILETAPIGVDRNSALL